MKIQKGIVKYKDRSDIVCTYGITDDGKQYYFLDENDEKRFANGNRIASTALVEAIDPMVKASNIGVIDENGNVVIPFENRSIRPISNDLVLVELANPVSSSVIDAVKLKSDPLTATKLVSTPALIKDKLNKKMGSEARYIFNDQFSEATICDINGNNLINNQYFSFIGMDSVNKKLYFSKNTPDSDIVEYSVLPPEVQSNIAGDNKGTSIDLGSVNVNQNVVEDALNGITFGEEPVKEDTPVQKVPTNQVFEGSVIENNVEQEQVSEVPQGDIETVTTPNSLIEGVPFDSSVSEKMVNNGEDINNVVLPFDEKKEETEVSEDSNVILPFEEKKEEEETIVSQDNNVILPFEVKEEEEVNNVVLPFDEKKEEDTKTSEDNKVVLPFDEKKEEVEVPFSNDSINNEVVSSEIVNQMINSSDNAIDLSDNNDKHEEEEVAVEEAKEEHEEDADTKKDDLPIDINDIVIPTVYEDEETASREEEQAKEEVSQESEVKVDDTASADVEEEKEEVSQESEVETEENPTDEDTNPKDKEDQVVEEVSQETEVKVDDAASADVEDEKEEVVDNKEEDSAIEETEDVNMEYDSKEVDLPVVDEEDDEEIFKDSVVRTDKIIDEDEEDIDFDTDDYKEESDYGETDNTMGDFVKSFSQLVNQNKEQRKELVMKDANIVKLKQRLAKVNNNRKEMLDDLQILRQNNESLSSKLRMSKDTISDLENTKKKLEGKIRSLEKAYEQMAREAETLRAKVSRNNGDMAKLLADAKDVLKGTGSKDIDFDYDDDSYLRRVA